MPRLFLFDFLANFCYNISKKGEIRVELSINSYNSNNGQVIEEFHTRKFWELLDASFVNKDLKKNSVKVPITSINQINELITIATNNRNYWGTYEDLPKLCEVRDDFEELSNNGWDYFLEANW